VIQIKSIFRIGRILASWSWPARAVAIGCFLVALYAALGFLILPPLVKSRLVEKLSAYTGRNVELGELRMNPFTLSTTLRKFELCERDGKRFIGFEELYINFQVSSIFLRTYTFAQLHLTAPYLGIKILKNGNFNCQDLLPSTREKDKTQQGTSFSLLIQHLAINHGQAVFEDHTRQTPFKAQIDDLSFSLLNFTTRPHREGLYEFEATTDQGETMKYFGNISMVPLYSKGKLELTGIKMRTLWSYLQDQFHFEVTSGELDINGNYEFDARGQRHGFLVHNGNINVRSLSVVNKEGGETTINVPLLTFSGTDIDYQKRQIKIARIQSDSSKIRSMLDKEMRLDLLKTFQLKSSDESRGIETNEPHKSSNWQISIGQIEISDYAFQMKDNSTQPAAHLDLSPINIKLEDVLIGAPGTAHIKLQAGLNQTGTITVTGTVAPDPLAAKLDLQLSKVALQPFQPYFKRYTKLDIENGAMLLNGHLNFSQRSGTQDIDFSGDIAIESARATDPVLEEDFIRWEQLDIKQIKYNNSPALLTINEIIARGLYTRIIIGPDHTANVQHLLVEKDNSSTKTSNQQTIGNRLPIRIDQVSVIDSSMNFSDLSLTPSFSTGVQNLNGTIKGLSSEQIAHAVIDLKGQVDKYAPVFIYGKINPLSEQAYTDITLNFQGIELTTFSPYSGKFAGYTIEKGRLALELNYRLSQKILKGENHIVMDQFTLGEKVESPDATKLPVRLAIAILKDSRGVIDIDLPVRGDLNDPEFSLAPLILKAIVNLIVKAATAPFKLLASLVGGEGEELSFVSFAPGSNSLSQEQQSKLAKLAKALGDRPQLRLDLRGTAAEFADRQALAERTVLARVRTQGIATPESPLTEDEQKRLLKLYRRTFNKENPHDLVSPTDKTGVKLFHQAHIPSINKMETKLFYKTQVPLTDKAGAKLSREAYTAAVVEAARRRLIEQCPIPEDDLLVLARERAVVVKDYLVQQGGVAEPRIFLLDVDTKTLAENGEIRMPLVLDAR
jgi:hypothetical protein